MGSSLSHGPLREEQGVDNWVASLACHSDAHFKEAVAEAAALHSRDELFSRHIEPEPAPEDPVDWATAEASTGFGISVVSRVRCPVFFCSVCPAQAPRQ